MLRIRQRVEVRGREPGADATGPYWVFAVVQVHRGALRYVHGGKKRAPPQGIEEIARAVRSGGPFVEVVAVAVVFATRQGATGSLDPER